MGILFYVVSALILKNVEIQRLSFNVLYMFKYFSYTFIPFAHSGISLLVLMVYLMTVSGAQTM
jgi:hypothetical protein